MITQKVRANTGGREGKWVGLIILSILAFASVTIPFHQAETRAQEVESHQILITDIEQENLAMIAELRLAHEEIRDIHADRLSELDIPEDSQEKSNHWPSIDGLQSDWIAPFVKDQSWVRKGEHTWLGLGKGLYLGVPAQLNAANAILLNSNDAEPQIWLSKTELSDPTKVLVIEDYQAKRLMKRGWKMVVMNTEQEKHPH